MRLDIGVVGDALDLIEAGLGLRHGVQELSGRAGTAAPLAALALRTGPLRLLDERAVQQHHREQVGRRTRRVHDPAKAKRAESWQQATVIHVRVREQHEVEIAWLKRPRFEIAFACFAPALMHAAVDQKANAIAFDEKA